LCQRYPFFKEADDPVALCEIACVVGTRKLETDGSGVFEKNTIPFSFEGRKFEGFDHHFISTFSASRLGGKCH
jgi:hypothetical protein